jgi:hypothetical protein
MRFFAIKQFSADDRCVIVHKISIPDWSEPGFYRSIGTLNAFLYGDKDRNNFDALHPNTARAHGKKPKKPTHPFWYYGEDWEEFQAAMERPLGTIWRDRPVLNHASIWDFYKHIGFDYKTVKYTK